MLKKIRNCNLLLMLNRWQKSVNYASSFDEGMPYHLCTPFLRRGDEIYCNLYQSSWSPSPINATLKKNKAFK